MFLKAFLPHICIAAMALTFSLFTNAQDVAKQALSSPAKTSTPRSASNPAPAKNWAALTESQKIALAPLESVWTNISPVKKQKWLDISVGYHLLSPEGQSTLHFRMKEWASLTTKEREQARKNFAQAKQLSPDDKQNKWQAYQALSPEERFKLAKANQSKQVTGAAPATIATKPGTDSPKAVFNTPQIPAK